MDSAEFRMKATALGLTNDALYRIFPVEKRAIRRWKTTTEEIPPYVAEYVNQQWDAAIDQANALLDTLEDAKKQTGQDPQAVDVPIYRSEESAEVAHPGIPIDILNHRAAVLAFLIEALGYTTNASFITHENPAKD